MDIRIGDKIKIIHMDGEPQYTGRIGIVDHIDDNQQIWLEGCGCALIPYVDTFEVIERV